MNNNITSMKSLSLDNKRVLIRQDLNVPIANGKVTSDKRIVASLPTIKMALEQNAAVMLMSHLGRPTEGEYLQEFSLQPVADCLSEHLAQPVELVKNWLDGVNVAAGQIVLLENVRFNQGEKANDDSLAKKMASLCDIFVMDAFGTAHRAQASTHGVAKYADQACAGPLLTAELDALDKALKQPESPVVAIVGGSKVSTKLTVLETLSSKVDQLIVGGGIANTFIAAAGYSVGQSLYESDLISQATALIENAKASGSEIPVPTDVVVATEFSDQASAVTKPVDQVNDDELILDIGPETAEKYSAMMKSAGTIVWNGPVGVFEIPQFAQGTKVMSQAIADSNAFSIAGGGDTLAAIDQFNLTDKISYISTGGGAFLEFLEGKTLPAVEILEQRSTA